METDRYYLVAKNSAAHKIVDYRLMAGAIGFQLEKMDDFIHMAKVAIAKALGETT